MDPKRLSIIRRLLCLTVLAAALVSLFVSRQALSQAGSSLSGTVVTKDGKPAPGVVVFGSIWKDCCPAQRDTVKTDGDGDFRIEHPGAVLHFIQDGFEPETVVVKQGAAQLRVTLSPATSDWMIPACSKPAHGLKRIGWGKYGVQFMVPRHAVKVAGGKTDVDYVRYVLRPKTGTSYMEIWFGPYSLPTDPDDDLFIASTGFSQRNIESISASDPFAGVDSSGHLKNGGYWRQAAIAGMGGAVYPNASAHDLAIFDPIINSMCHVPYPRR